MMARSTHFTDSYRSEDKGQAYREVDLATVHISRYRSDDGQSIRFLGRRIRDLSSRRAPRRWTSWGLDLSTYTERNVLVTQRLLEFVREHPVDRLVYASSSSIYGNAGIYPVTEAALPRPFSPYGVTKLAAEHLCSLYAENYGVATVSLRYFTVYGPGQRPDMAFTRFIRALQDDEDITINGDGGQIRDFTYVGDVVRANIAAAFAPGLGSRASF